MLNPIRLCVLGASVIFSVGCSHWDWKPNPYEADSATQAVYRGDGKIIRADESEFSTLTCFDQEDIATLKDNIDRVKIYEKEAKKRGILK
jgi:hypothetical protein